jgi:hypothetical protein
MVHPVSPLYHIAVHPGVSCYHDNEYISVEDALEIDPHRFRPNPTPARVTIHPEGRICGFSQVEFLLVAEKGPYKGMAKIVVVG